MRADFSGKILSWLVLLPLALHPLLLQAAGTESAAILETQEPQESSVTPEPSEAPAGSAAPTAEPSLPAAQPGKANGKSVTVGGKTYRWVEGTRRYVGSAVRKMTGAVDSYLSRDPAIVQNDSFLRLRLGYTFEEDGAAFPSDDIKLKVDLPKTRHKWSLIFESDPDEFEGLEEQQQDNLTTARASENTDGSIGAVRFVLNDWRKWKNDVDVGVKTPSFNPFIRFNTRRTYRLDEDWRVRIRNSMYFVNNEGFGERASLVLYRRINPDWMFFNDTSLRWQEEGQVLEYGDVVTFQQWVTDRDEFRYRFGASYQEHPGSFLKGYFVDTIYRRRLHAHWLYGEITPAVTWKKSEHFNDTASLTFRIEVVFD